MPALKPTAMVPAIATALTLLLTPAPTTPR